jgi:hypothetical protein
MMSAPGVDRGADPQAPGAAVPLSSALRDPLYPNSSAPIRKDFVIEKWTAHPDSARAHEVEHIFLQPTQTTQSSLAPERHARRFNPPDAGPINWDD